MLIIFMVKKILMQICQFNTLFSGHQVEDVILFTSKLSIFIF
jgi:hypothetical protein